ncbi:MAG TPA: hypothetical protein VNL91_00180 [Thermoanaerobaculia bacterium]|nr:hypothetical protein [Thermoanaerobaculia bacterium]
MKIPFSLLPLLLAAAPVLAQTDIRTTIDPSRAAKVVPIAVPFPDVRPPADPREIDGAFFGPLTRDLAASALFALMPLPPNIPPSADLAKRVHAQFLLRMSLYIQNGEHFVEARLIDTTGHQQFGRRYHGPAAALTLMAHKLANDLVREFTGRPGIFESQIAFASNRDGAWEIYLMDWDGSNQRRITRHNALSLLPSFSHDNQRMAYTSFARGTSDLYIISRLGGARVRVPTGLGLNVSAAFSPISNDIAFVGSVNGNPDIYVIRDDGTNLRRLTTASSIESTPEWSPNGRQISFTSGRSGTPQIYVMDAEGTNVRRISFEGEWNDDATWSPDGEQLAYTSRVAGRFQIRIANLVTGQSRIIAGEGSNEQPTWSPDGQWLAFQSNRSGKWQIYRVRVDGTDLIQLTFAGENKEPDWSKKGE